MKHGVVNRTLLMHLRFWCFTLACFCTPSAQAIVSMEDLHLGAPPEGFSGQLELAINGVAGNTRKSSSNFGTRMQWHKKQHTNFLVLNYAYGRSQGITDTNKGFVHLRHIYQTRATRAWEAFAQATKNEFTRLSLRTLLGGGTRLALIERQKQKAAFLGLGAFYEQEKLSNHQTSTDERTSNLWRANLYFVFKYRFNTGVTILSSTYYQPSVNTPSDYRLSETASLNVKLADNLALSLSLDIAHDSRPPQNVTTTDTSYQTGITYSF
jgi:putative salt-induced outer membrane protein YdiY